MNKIKVGSDFSGVGAFDQALKRLGIDYETIFACDMDKYARQTFIHNYGEPKYYPQNVYDREIPKESLDIYMTSPPCQAFSLAGKRKGEDDKRGVLFYNSHEFIKQNKPRYFIFENVKGLLSDDNGKTFGKWVDLLGGKSVNGNQVMFPNEDSVPYHIYHKVLNAKNYVVPQNRERIFIVGIRDDADNNFSFPKEIPLTKRLKDVLEKNVDEKYYLSDVKDKRLNEFITLNNPKELELIDTYNQVSNAEVTHTITTSCNQGVLENTIQKVAIIDDTYKNRNARVYNNIAPTIRSEREGLKVENNYRIRKLTPRECFSLMDFPEDFDFSVVSDSQAYKQAGNSIVVNVLAEIIKKLNLKERN